MRGRREEKKREERERGQKERQRYQQRRSKILTYRGQQNETESQRPREREEDRREWKEETDTERENRDLGGAFGHDAPCLQALAWGKVTGRIWVWVWVFWKKGTANCLMGDGGTEN